MPIWIPPNGYGNIGINENYSNIINSRGSGVIIPNWLRSSLVSWQDGAKRNGVYYPLTNLVTNGNFANGTTGWLGIDTVVDGIAKRIATAQNTGMAYWSAIPLSSVKGHKIYFTGLVKADSTSVILTLNDGVGGTTVPHTANNVFERLSGIRAIDVNAIQFYIKVQDGRTSGWTEMQGDDFVMVDLTARFGAGNEPTTTEMDAIFAADGTPYWDGTRNVLCNPGGKYYWYDYSGNGRNLKLTNFAYTTVSGWSGNQLVLDGTDDYLRRVMATAQADGTSYSFTAIVKSAASKNTVNLHTSTTLAMSIGLDASGYPTVTAYDTAIGAYTVTDNSSKAAVLTQIIAVVDITAMKLYLYVNGVSKGTPATLANTVRGFSTISIGTNAATNAYVALTIAQTALINKALAGYEAAQIYNGSKRRYVI